MNTFIKGITLLFLIGACNLVSEKDEENRIIPGTDAFFWSSVNNQYSNISYIGITGNDLLVITTDSGWYTSKNYAKDFEFHNNPEGSSLESIKYYDGIFYAIGKTKVQQEFFGDSSSVIEVDSNLLFRSTDGQSWERILGPFKMKDIILDHNNYLHVSKYNGVSSIDLNSGEEFLNEFLFTNSLDYIRVMDIDEQNNIYATSHDGIYKSSDSGKNWIKVTEEIRKSEDETRFIKVLGNENYIAQGATRLFLSDDGENWSIRELFLNRPSGYQGEMMRSSQYSFSYTVTDDSYGIDLDAYGVLVSKPEELNELYYAGPQGYNWDFPFPFNYVKSFSNGNIIVYSGQSGFMIGYRNSDSDFWD
jgi:hypothetical protein